MSWKTVYNPASRLSFDTRNAIRAAGVSLDNYASNIDDHLRQRGLDELADTMQQEIANSHEEWSSR